MDFLLLGDLEIRDQGGTLRLSGGKQKALVAALLINANHVVPVDKLIDELWGGDASPKAAGNLHTLVSRLRGRIGTDRLERHGCGYVLRVADGELDLHRFEQLGEEGRQALERGEPEMAAAKLYQALEIWRGPALADFTYEPWAANEIRRLEEHRLVVLEERIEADLGAGRHAELVGELHALVAEHPLREELRRQLIVALYRSGRQAEALEAYRDTRRTLDEELGLEPSPALRELEQAVLRQDPSLELPRDPVPPAGELPSRPFARPARFALALAAAALAFGGAAGTAVLLRLAQDKATEASAAPQAAPVDVQGAPTTVPVRRVKRSQAVSVRPKRTRTSRPARVAGRRLPRIAPAQDSRTLASVRPGSAAHGASTQTPPMPKPKPAPLPAVRVADNFDDGEIDRRTWNDAVAGTGVTIDERDGRLEMSFAGDAQPGGPNDLLDGHYGTQCRFIGDFDARVDFELLDWPVANGVVVQLTAWSGAGGMTAGRQSQSWDEGEGYVSSSPSIGTQMAAGDVQGTVRIRRAGLVTTSSYWSGTRWARLVAFSSSPIATIGAPLFGLQAISTSQTFGRRPVRVAFDNFVLTARQSAC